LLDARKDRRSRALCRYVVAFGLDTAGDLHVEELVAAAVAVHQLAEGCEPARALERRRHPDLGEAAIEARHVRLETVCAPVIDRQHFVGAVAEQEAAIERGDARL